MLDFMRVQKEIQETVCFTGHRKLGMPERELEKKTADLIWKAIQKGYTHFISGAAVGYDLIAAEQVIMIRDIGVGLLKPITLEIAIPCENQTKNWSAKQKRHYQLVLDNADVISEAKMPYSSKAMMNRNKFMVSKSALVIAYYEQGRTGGTKNAIEYAEGQGREVWYV